jgi:hypothetical protein
MNSLRNVYYGPHPFGPRAPPHGLFWPPIRDDLLLGLRPSNCPIHRPRCQQDRAGFGMLALTRGSCRSGPPSSFTHQRSPWRLRGFRLDSRAPGGTALRFGQRSATQASQFVACRPSSIAGCGDLRRLQLSLVEFPVELGDCLWSDRWRGVAGHGSGVACDQLLLRIGDLHRCDFCPSTILAAAAGAQARSVCWLLPEKTRCIPGRRGSFDRGDALFSSTCCGQSGRRCWAASSCGLSSRPHDRRYQ